jgi:hypothetical protein
METHSRTRRKILEALYSLHLENPSGAVDSDDLLHLLGFDDMEAYYEDLQFLFEEEYVEGTPVPFLHRGYLRNARITQKGAAVVSNTGELDRAFPVDRENEAVEAFVESLRQAVQNADMSSYDKETVLEELAKFLSLPKARDILAGVLLKRAWG